MPGYSIRPKFKSLSQVNDEYEPEPPDSFRPLFFRWHCPNCAEIACAYADDNGIATVQCKKCGVKMKHRSINRRKDIIEMTNSR